ncbi:MAG: GLPGLI family protein [Taibaiella sp.]|nr:GLPGLI family protein [Taibaiella sp.]
MKRHLLIYLFLLVATAANAQHTLAGKIEYERRVNMHAQMAEMEGNAWVEKMKAQLPKFNTTYFDMVFDTNRIMYKPGREVTENAAMKMFGSGPATQNVVLTDFHANKVKANKAVFDQKFSVEDTLRVMEWKEKDEIRTIANFKCRKAVGIICDSVYVVAFYAEDIPVAGGPESFGGLPGMILELAIPRLHTTWVATKVDVVAPKAEDFDFSEKGKKVNSASLYESVSESFRKWGAMGTRQVWWVAL